MKKILIAAAVATLLAVSAVAASFEKIQTYSDGMFTDVASSAWYAGDVKNSYEFGLVNGVGANKFDPNGTVTVAQAITLAARFNSVYNGETIGSANGEWYTPYVEYAVKKGIITGNQFDSYTRAAKRIEVAALFAGSLPKDYFKPLNAVYSIPDLAENNPNYDELMTLYRAGIAMGNDAKGTFSPDANITRAEFSALINRVASPGKRLVKSFYNMPKDDAYMIVDTVKMAYTDTDSEGNHLPSGWQCDNKNVEYLEDGKIEVMVAEESKEDYVTLYRDFDKVENGTLSLELSAYIFSKDNGAYIGFADDNGKVYAGVKTDSGVFTVIGAQETKTSIPVATSAPEEYAIILNVDLDNNEMYAYINGARTENVKISDGIGLSKLVIGTTKEGTGYILPCHARVYRNYAFVESFLASEAVEGDTPYSMNVTGDITIEKYRSIYAEDEYSVKVSAKAGAENIASTSFSRISGKGIFEAYILLPEGTDGAFFAVTSANGDVVRITSKDGAWYAGNQKLRDFTKNVWQQMRIETDTAAKKAIIKICGKKVGEIAISAEYIDGIKIGMNSEKDAVMWFDDLLAKTEIDHADYPAAPAANNDDGYNIGIHVCNLWHDAQTSEGWQAAAPFDELETYFGYYDEGSAELADWEIKTMAEHGIDFQHLCWYAPGISVDEPIKKSQTAHHALHDGYFNAKYSDAVKFAIMWENTGLNRGSFESFKNYIWDYWKEYYFSDSRYMTVENKPILTMWSVTGFINYFGGVDKAKEAVKFMREDIKTLGFDDIIIMSTRQNGGKEAEIGFDAMYYYHYKELGYSADHQIETLTKDLSENGLHIIPTLAIGHNAVGRFDTRTPLISLEDHKKVAEYIKNDYLPAKKTGTWKDNTLFISTWNEYTEGHYIAPNNLTGYGYLENIKDVFTNDKSDHSKIDVKLTDAQKERINKMYPETYQPIRILRKEKVDAVLKYKPIATWDFSKSETLDRWKIYSTEIDQITADGVKAHGTNDDPVFQLYDADIDLSSKPQIHIRMKVKSLSTIDVFFTTSESTSFEQRNKYKAVPIETAGEFVDYYIDFSTNSFWSARLTGLRIDPVRTTDNFEISLIEIVDVVSNEAEVVANGRTMKFDFPTKVVDGDVEATANPRNGFFTMLNLHYSWNRYTGKLLIESKTNSLVLTVGENTALLDGNKVNLGYTFTTRDGLPVIRMKKVCELLGLKTSFDGSTLTVTSTDRKAINPQKAGYYGWDFDVTGNKEGWNSYNVALSSADGKLYICGPKIEDTQIFVDNIKVNANEYKKLKIGMYADPEDLKGKFFQLFFDGTGKGMSEAKSVKHYYDTAAMKSGELYEFEIELSENYEWKGNISNFRIDFYNAKVDSAIEYFRFYPAEQELPPMQEDAEMAEVRRIDFDSVNDGNKFWGDGFSKSVSGGYLELTSPASPDIAIYLDGVNLSANDCDIVKIGIKTTTAGMSGKFFQLFFKTDSDKTLDEKKSMKVNYNLKDKKDGDLYEVVFDMNKNANWKGTITNLRFDPFNSQVDAYIDYIVFAKSESTASADTGASATGTFDKSKVVYAWDFEGSSDAKASLDGYGAAVLAKENGMLAIKNPKSADTQAYFLNMNLDASKVSKITIGIKADKAAMAGNFFQMFFMTDSEPSASEKNSFKHNYNVSNMPDGSIYELTFDAASMQGWNGTVTRLRLDPFNYQADAFIDYIYMW